MAVDLRRLRTDEGELLRAVRLRALADSPEAFGATFAQESALSAADWSERAAEGAAGLEFIIFVAVEGTEPLAMAGGSTGDGSDISLWGMWVDPTARGEHLGARLVQAVVGWGRSLGAIRLRLGVMTDAVAVIGFYEHLGFQRIGQPHRLTRDPSRSWWEMTSLL